MKLELLFNQSSNSPVDEYTVVKQSEIQGYGLFAKKFIPKGKMWWHARVQDVLVIEKDQFLRLAKSFEPPASYSPRLTENFVTCILYYATYDVDIDAFVFSLDNARYVNHSENPNSAEGKEKFSSLALRDIQPGEEITEDYSRYGKAPWIEYKVF